MVDFHEKARAEQLERISGRVGWKSVLLLQFLPQFQMTIFGGILICYVVVITHASFAMAAPKATVEYDYYREQQAIMYAFDVFYFLDLILMTIFKNIHWPEIRHLHESRNAFILFLEYISLVPIDAMAHGRKQNVAQFYYLRFRYLLRITRLWTLIKKKQNASTNKSTMKFIATIGITFTFAAITMSCILMVIFCQQEECTFPSVGKFINWLYLINSKLTGRGFGVQNVKRSDIHHIVLSIVSYSSFVFVSYTTSKLAFLFVARVKQIFLFAHKYVFIKDGIREWKSSNTVQWKNYHKTFFNTMNKFFSTLLYNRTNISGRNIPREIIPKILFKDIAMDMSWNAFKHSHLFRDEEAYFIRSLSVLMTHEFYTPGEIIFKKHQYKSCMIYILTGTVQILSEENSETPIISLSAGTCLGESTLLYDYPSTFTVISKTYSEISMLRRKHFIKVGLVYPKIFQTLVKRIKFRYAEAQYLYNLFQYQTKLLKLDYSLETLTTLWVKQTSYKMLNNQHIRRRFNKKIDDIVNKIAFSPKYLDLVVVNEELESVTDTVFFKKEFPFIFQPDCILLKGWDMLVILAASSIVMIYPYLLCVSQSTSISSYTLAYIIISVLWVLDVYFQISTAVKSKNFFYTQFSDIIYYKLGTFSFLVDILCLLPLGPLLGVINGTITSDVYLIAEIHKLSKFYKVEQMFSKMGGLNSSKMIFNNYVKITIYIFLLLYYSAGFLYYTVCSGKTCNAQYLKGAKVYINATESDIGVRMVHLYTVVSLFTSDINMFEYLIYIPNRWYFFIIAMQLAYACIVIYILAKSIAIDTVNQQEKHEFKELVSNIKTIMKNFNYTQQCQRRIWSYLKNQFYLDRGIYFLQPDLCIDVMSDNLFLIFRQVLYGKFLHNVPLFKNLDENFIMEVATKISIDNYPAGEVITYAGEVCKEMHLILNGYCKQLNRNGTIKALKPKECFSVLETCLKLPTVNTVTTSTDCKIISLSVEKFSSILSKYPEVRKGIDLAISSSITKEDLKKVGDEKIEVDTITRQEVKAASFRHFKYGGKRRDNLEYHNGFTKWSFIFKYILLRHTITPYGNFLFWWEITRCIFAFATNIFTSFTNVCTDCFLFYTLLVLDISAWVDIYVRQHVGYFNNQGTEVSHPMLTAIHYWKNGLLVDFLGAAPIDYLINNKIKMYLRINRLLQIHRIFGFFSYIDANNLSRSNTIDVLKYFPLTILLINYFSSIFLYSSCDLEEKRILNDTDCTCGAQVFAYNHMNGKFDRINAHGASIMITTCVLALIGFATVRPKQMLEMIFINVMTLIGLIFYVWLTAKMVANNFYRNTELTSYQEAMKELLHFMNYRKIDKNIKKEVIEHFEHMWKKKQGKNLDTLLQSFSTCFKEDILFDLFGKHLQASDIFPNASVSFFKSLLLEVKHEVFLKRGIIYRVNDIHGSLYFLMKGQVEVLGPDFNRLLVLHSGSLFGSLDNCPLTRQTLMMVAKSNVEVLKIHAVTFHSILSKYRGLDSHFRRLIAHNVDYLESNNFAMFDDILQTEHLTQQKKSKLKDIYVRLNPVYDNNIFMKSWEMFVAIVVCFIGFHLEAYQKVIQPKSPLFTVMLYTFDLLYLCRIYLKFHTCYMDEYGTVIRNRSKIARRYLKTFFGFYFDLMSIIPLEAISLLFMNHEKYFWYAMIWCRLNRLIRITLVLEILKATKEKLHVNVVAMRIIFMITWLTIIIHLMACILFYCRLIELNDVEKSQTDRVHLYYLTCLVVIYTSTGSAINSFKMQFNIWIIICVMLIITISRFIVTIFISEICATLEAVNKSKNKYEEYAIYMIQFLKDEGISEPVQKSIKEYINLLWHYHRGVQFPSLLEQSPYYLREATLNAMFGFHIRRHEILQKCHMDLIRQMAAKLRIIIFFPGNYIAYVGDVDESMYFIHEGEVDVLTENTLYNETVLKTLRDGDSFGFAQGLYQRCGHNYTYIARKYSVIVVLERRHWFHMLCFFPASQELIYDEEEAMKYI